MEFLNNNLAIIISAITIISGCFNFYQYIENRKLKRFATEKDLKRREASLERLQNNYESKKANSLGLNMPGEEEKEENEFICRKKEIEAEIEYLEKVLKKKK